ncbi:MAG: DUF2889 domain-containing protein [Lautropia sp.]
MARELLHTRSITLHGYRRTDGRYELDGRLTDVRTYPLDIAAGGHRAAGEPLHDMTVRMVFDAEMLIHSFEAAMAATPHRTCLGAAPNFDRLAGLSIKPGFLREAHRRVAGIDGCTHLRELLQQVATTAYQTVVGDRIRERGVRDEAPGERPKLLDSCTGYRADGDWVRIRWPQLYTGGRSASQTPPAGDHERTA